jgi:hypothetical protein
MNIEPTTHYQLSGASADNEWAALAPNDGRSSTSASASTLTDLPHSISLFHQRIRRNMIAEPSSSGER